MSTYKTLRTADGVPIDALHENGDRGLAIVVAHGFSGSRRRPSVRRVTSVFHRCGGVIGFDFRGHGASGGKSTMAAPDDLLARMSNWLLAQGFA